MGFRSKELGTDKTEVRSPSPRRDGLGAALRHALGSCETLPEDIESRLTRIDAVTSQRPSRRR